MNREQWMVRVGRRSCVLYFHPRGPEIGGLSFENAVYLAGALNKLGHRP